jgi:hypothetical protein
MERFFERPLMPLATDAARYAEVFGKILLRHVKVRQYVLAQNGAGVRRAPVRIS